MKIDWSLWEVPKQKYSSANTSINSGRLPRLFTVVKKHLGWTKDTMNFDIGSGKYLSTIHEFFTKHKILPFFYDPFTLEWAVNTREITSAYGRVDTVTISNVLNVIAEKKNRIRVLQQAKAIMKSDGTVYISVYPKEGCGVGEETKPDCWQSNKKLSEYEKEVGSVFPFVEIRHGIMIARLTSS